MAGNVSIHFDTVFLEIFLQLDIHPTLINRFCSIPVQKDIFVKALNAEGIPCLSGYNFPLNEHSIMKSPAIQRCPVGCSYYGKKIDYTAQVFPISSQAI